MIKVILNFIAITNCDAQIYKKKLVLAALFNRMHMFVSFKRLIDNLLFYKIFCRKQGATLLQINNANENKWLTKNFPNGKHMSSVNIFNVLFFDMDGC